MAKAGKQKASSRKPGRGSSRSRSANESGAPDRESFTAPEAPDASEAPAPPDEIEVAIAWRLRHFRMRAGLSIEDVAKVLRRRGYTRVTSNAVSKWEASPRKKDHPSMPGASELRGLAFLYEVTVDELMGAPPPENRPLPERLLRKDETRRKLERLHNVCQGADDLLEEVLHTALDYAIQQREISVRHESAARSGSGRLRMDTPAGSPEARDARDASEIPLLERIGRMPPASAEARRLREQNLQDRILDYDPERAFVRRRSVAGSRVPQDPPP